MFKNLLKITLRNLLKFRVYSAINIFGLALGMSCGLVIFLLVQHDLSIDDFQVNKDRIYRVTTFGKRSSEYYPGSAFPLASALREDFPEFERVAHVLYVHSGQFTVVPLASQQVRYQEDEGVAFVEQSFFEMFDVQWVAGSPKGALGEPNSVVLALSLARKFFPDGPALNRVIRLDNEVDLKVTGVIQDLPPNTNFPFTALVSFGSLDGFNAQYVEASWNWTNSSLQAFVLLASGVRPAQIEARLPDFVQKHMGARATERLSLLLQPLEEIHFDPRYFDNFYDRTVSRATIFALVLLGIFMIVSACINFVNLSTAQAARRSKEVGVRKAAGSSRVQLVSQFLLETGVITILSALLAIALTEFFLLQLSQFVDLGPVSAVHLNGSALVLLALISAAVIVLAGFYPSLVLSRFNPAQAIQNRIEGYQARGFSLRQGLVVTQFAISHVLIIATLVVVIQLNYFGKQSLGFNQQAIVTLPLPENDPSKLSVLRNRLLESANIVDLTFANGPPSDDHVTGSEYTYRYKNREERVHVQFKFVDEYYVDIYGLELLAGRKLLPDDSPNNILVNETFLRWLEVENAEEAIGQPLPFGNPDRQIVGVVSDFNTQSLHEEIGACFLLRQPDRFSEAGVRVNLHNVSDALQHVERVWSETYPLYVFSYEFLEDKIARFYEEERRLGRLIKISSVIIVFIGCLGLYGLLSFVVVRKTKEMGIRKVLGASPVSLLALFIGQFFKPLGLAFLLASPISYLVMNQWLQNFSYRIELSPGLFLLAAGLTIGVALLTVAYQSIKTVLANPVESLRYE